MSKLAILAATSATLLVVVMGACGKGPTAPPGPRATVADLEGTWAGKIDTGSAQLCLGIKWSATPGASSSTGTAQVRQIHAQQPFIDPAVGTMTATESGNSFSLAMTFPAGAFAHLGSSTCSMTATGTVNASQTAMSGTVTEEWTPPCNGTVWTARPTNTFSGNLAMTKESAGGHVPTTCAGSTGSAPLGGTAAVTR